MKIFVRDGQFFADGFAVRHSFLLEEGESRLISYISEKGCGAAVVTLQGKEVTVEGEGLIVILRREGWELRPLTSDAKDSATLTVEGRGESYLVESIGGSSSRLIVKGSADCVFRNALPIFSPSLRLIEGQKESIVELTAHCSLGRYIAMIALSNGNARLLMEDYGDTILCRGNEITLKRRFSDSRGREVTKTYLWQGDGFSLTREFTYRRDLDLSKERMGTELLEGVIARDDESITALLSSGVGAPNMIYDYFGEVIEIDDNYPRPSPTAAGAIVKVEGKLRARLYDFDFDTYGKIENIRSLDE